MLVLPLRYESTMSQTRIHPLSFGGFCSHRGFPLFGIRSSVIGPPIVESRSAASRMARSSAVAAADTVATCPCCASNQRRRLGEFLLARYPDLRHAWGSTGALAQIVSAPSTSPPDSIRTFVVLRKGSL